MLIRQVMGGVHLRVRACARADVPSVPYLGNGRTDSLKFGAWLDINWLCVLHYSGVGRICTCARAHPFSVSGMAGRIELKFGSFNDFFSGPPV